MSLLRLKEQCQDLPGGLVAGAGFSPWLGS